MDKVHDAFRKAIRQQLDRQENWQPTRRLDVGVILSRQGDELIPVSSLQQKGIDVGINQVAAEEVLFTFGKGTNYSVKAAGQAQAGTVSSNAEIHFGFENESGVFLSAAGCHTETIANQEKVLDAIRSLAVNGEWNDAWIFVEEVFRAKKLNLLISGSDKAELTAEAKGNLPNIDLADAELGLKTTAQKGVVLNILGASDATPWFRGLTYSNGWRGERILVSKHNLGSNDDEECLIETRGNGFEEFVLL